MTIIKTLMEDISNIEKKITVEIKKGTRRDKSIIKKLQDEHVVATTALALAHEDDGLTPKDKKDHTGDEFRKEQENKQKEKQREFDLNLKGNTKPDEVKGIPKSMLKTN